MTTTARRIDQTRREASDRLDPKRRAALGQFMTPSAIAEFMVSLFRRWPSHARLLDPGAGIGSLTDAFADRFFRRAPPGAHLDVTAYEIDPLLRFYLSGHLAEIESRARSVGYAVSGSVVPLDFIAAAAFELSLSGPRYSHAILNPPYAKLSSTSQHRLLLRKAGIEAVNLYGAFLALAVGLTEEGGEIVAIVPRSWCNGSYFRPLRTWLLERVALRHIHVFESRTRAFGDDGVLQENVIVRFERRATQGNVTVSCSHDPSFSDYVERDVSFDRIVKPEDAERFIHIPTAESQSHPLFACRLSELGLSVATGPVVDFRVRDFWLADPNENSVPLLYAHHFAGGTIQWPRRHRKPNALTLADETRKWLMPRGWYTVTKRFSSKEERRRVVAYVVDPQRLPCDFFGFENHLNVLHQDRSGLDADLARGLAIFLNSTVVDEHFRTFSGHTQVNATDLRNMLFPPKATLVELGKRAAGTRTLTQEKIDRLIEDHA